MVVDVDVVASTATSTVLPTDNLLTTSIQELKAPLQVKHPQSPTASLTLMQRVSMPRYFVFLAEDLY